jgi:hypothetical protein
MTVKPPTKPPESTPAIPVATPVETTFKPFQPEMPQIPGVTDGSKHAKYGLDGPKSRFSPELMVAVGVLVLLVGGGLWWVMSRSHAATATSPETQVAEQAAPEPPLPSPIAPIHEGPTLAATADELSKPWSTKKFNFVKPITQENIDAMVIRLPNGELWAFSLQSQFGKCELEFIPDLPRLASRYHFNASHPMVVNPCDGTVYDPLKLGAVGGNTWVRGQIVQGSGLRPPISIDVKARGKNIMAESIE